MARFEDEDMFHWVFENFAALFGSAPEVIFTDSDKAMANAIKAEWPTTKHLLCTWHLYKNFYEHFRSLFAGKNNKVKWNEVCDIFWQLCKLSDVTGQLTFDSRMKVLSSAILPHIELSDRSEKKKQGDRDFLTSLADRRHQWAACYTWLHTTYGIHSTQRAEAINSSIKTFCSKKSKIVDLVDDLERMSSKHHLKAEVDALRHLFCTSTGNRSHLHPSATALAPMLEGYAGAIVEAQAGQLSLYKTLPIESNPLPDLSCVRGWTPFGENEQVYCVVINIPQDYVTEAGARRETDHGIGDPTEFTSPQDGWEFEDLCSQLSGGAMTEQQGSAGTTEKSAELLQSIGPLYLSAHAFSSIVMDSLPPSVQCHAAPELFWRYQV
ncbi:MAG: hypothetical protein HC938_11620 [Nitrospira sp.]|nr:hypothetical protein [Nitrospira sp.]